MGKEADAAALLAAGLRLVRPLGGGKAGIVHEAVAVLDLPYAKRGERLAVKIYRPWVLEEPGQLERIEQELASSTRVRAPGIVRAHQLLGGGERRFLVMEYLEGPTLEDWIREHPQPPGDQVLAVARDLAAGLGALHTNGLLHRDVKPSNIVLAPRGAVLLDLGVVKDTARTSLTEEGKFLGTIDYAAPEYLFGEACDERADVFSFGAVLHRLVLGRPVVDPDLPWSVRVLARGRRSPDSVALEAAFQRFGFRLGQLFYRLLRVCLAGSVGLRPRMADVLTQLREDPRSAPFPAGIQRQRLSLPGGYPVLEPVTDGPATWSPEAAAQAAVLAREARSLTGDDRRWLGLALAGAALDGGHLARWGGRPEAKERARAMRLVERGFVRAVQGQVQRTGEIVYELEMTLGAWRILLDGLLDPDIRGEAVRLAAGPLAEMPAERRAWLAGALQRAAGRQGWLREPIDANRRPGHEAQQLLRRAEDLGLLEEFEGGGEETRAALTPLGWRIAMDRLR